MNTWNASQSGVGIVEVLIALAVMMFTALGISTLQSKAMISMSISAVHFGIDEHSRDMLELLRANSSEATAGQYDYDFESDVIVDAMTHPVVRDIAQWKNQISDQLPDGAGQIDCDATRCQVSIRWKEYIDGSYEDQFYHIAGLL